MLSRSLLAEHWSLACQSQPRWSQPAANALFTSSLSPRNRSSCLERATCPLISVSVASSTVELVPAGQGSCPHTQELLPKTLSEQHTGNIDICGKATAPTICQSPPRASFSRLFSHYRLLSLTEKLNWKKKKIKPLRIRIQNNFWNRRYLWKHVGRDKETA